MQMAFMLLMIFLKIPAIFFAVVNILRIWGDFRCLCLSGLFLQKQLRTVFWQQEAYKNLEKKNKAFETEQLQKECTSATISKICKVIMIYIKDRTIFLWKITHRFIQSGCSLDHSCDQGGMCGNALVTCDGAVTFGHHCHVWLIEIG